MIFFIVAPFLLLLTVGTLDLSAARARNRRFGLEKSKSPPFSRADAADPGRVDASENYAFKLKHKRFQTLALILFLRLALTLTLILLLRLAFRFQREQGVQNGVFVKSGGGNLRDGLTRRETGIAIPSGGEGAGDDKQRRFFHFLTLIR